MRLASGVPTLAIFTISRPRNEPPVTTTAQPRIRILIADDHSVISDTLTPMLEPHFAIIGSVSDGKAALDAADRLHPDVIILDISMPLMSGIDAARQLRKKGSKAVIVFLTVHEDTDILAAAKAVGQGYVVKARLGTDLIPAIKEALAGRVFVSPFQV
jgi:DNA-binding NarL/FixJ family response regulator